LPDLSPLELCWAILKKAVTILMPTTIEQLKEIVTHAWEQIPQRSIDRLCLSFPARLLT
jgi:transposase